jgi:hypothetical protein
MARSPRDFIGPRNAARFLRIQSEFGCIFAKKPIQALHNWNTRTLPHLSPLHLSLNLKRNFSVLRPQIKSLRKLAQKVLWKRLGIVRANEKSDISGEQR